TSSATSPGSGAARASASVSPSTASRSGSCAPSFGRAGSSRSPPTRTTCTRPGSSASGSTTRTFSSPRTQAPTRSSSSRFRAGRGGLRARSFAPCPGSCAARWCSSRGRCEGAAVRDDVRAFVDLCSRLFAAAGPVVEIGALQTPGQEGYADLRPFFAGRPYFGCDLARGAGVDCVQDAEALGIAADSLEHVADPFRATGEIPRVLAPGGTAIVAVPFLFPIHYAPDYWRFTPEGVRRLLAPFPVAAVWSLGDAQWPHTVFAVAHKAIDDAGAARFAAAAAQLPARWDATPVRDVLLPFVPVTSLLRRDDGAAQPVPLGPAGVEQELVCPGDRLARIDVRIETPADG